ncbi:hypothetical protein PP502_gp29 [Gordonia phage Beenie]|uniref:Uncharacterized protein n=1 Tax=Gordonia phage Beenie TaxID=2079397 RepID=A0A2K9VH88_9CAUD|nr:hypothetical protein PP502_gp29 [Gordonia phage Beenie]AUV61594.1 hypothetical protein PBI_BEENIE_29 [Gordonia phage Beenie]
MQLKGRWLRVASRTGSEVTFDDVEMRTFTETRGVDLEYPVRRPS